MIDGYQFAEYIRSEVHAATAPTFQEVEESFDSKTTLLFQQLVAHIPYGVAYEIALVGNESAWMALNAQEIQIAVTIYNRIMGIDQ
jgi:hypothetical protein